MLLRRFGLSRAESEHHFSDGDVGEIEEKDVHVRAGEVQARDGAERHQAEAGAVAHGGEGCAERRREESVGRAPVEFEWEIASNKCAGEVVGLHSGGERRRRGEMGGCGQLAELKSLVVALLFE